MAGDWSRPKKSERRELLRFIEVARSVKPMDMLPMESSRPPPQTLAIDGRAFAIVLQLIALVVFLFLIIVFSEVPVRMAEVSRFFRRYRAQKKSGEREKDRVEELKEVTQQPRNDSKEKAESSPWIKSIHGFMMLWFQHFLNIRSKIQAAVEGKK